MKTNKKKKMENRISHLVMSQEVASSSFWPQRLQLCKQLSF